MLQFFVEMRSSSDWNHILCQLFFFLNRSGQIYILRQNNEVHEKRVVIESGHVVMWSSRNKIAFLKKACSKIFANSLHVDL